MCPLLFLRLRRPRRYARIISKKSKFKSKEIIASTIISCEKCCAPTVLKNNLCRKYHLNNINVVQFMSKIEWPSPEEMKKMVWEQSTVKIAKFLGVSDVAVAKYCQKHNIEKPKRGYWSQKINKLS